MAAAVVVANGALGGLPFLLLGLAALVVVVLRAIHDGGRVGAPLRLDVAILLALVLGLVRAPGAHLEDALSWVLIGAAVVVAGGLGVAAWRLPSAARPRVLGAAILVWVVAGALVIVRSPHPRIDVFDLEEGGARALLHGQNPYAASYPNVYTPEETEKYFGDRRLALTQYPYPPLSLFLTTAGYALLGDVRWALLAIEALLPVLLYALARSRGHPPRFAVALGVLQLVHPRGTFVLEQAWTDGLIGAAFLLFLLLSSRRASAWAIGAGLGLFFAAKQYSILLVPLLVPRRVLARSVWAPALLVAAVLTVPLALWGLHDFVDDVVLFQLRQPARPDAMSLPGLLQWATGVRLPGALALVSSVAVLGAWLRRGLDARDLALASACVYAVFFVTAKQAFCNYYYFLGIVLLGAVALAEPSADPAPATTPRG